MKDYKWSRIIKYLLGGFIVGIVVGITKKGILEYIGELDINSMLQSITPYVFILATILCSIGCGGYLYFNKLLKKDAYSNEEGSLYDKNDKKINVTMSLSTIGIIINFIAFGLSLGEEIVESSIFVLIIFIVNSVIGMGEISNISLMKKIRPELNADPCDKEFKKEYFNKLDEREQFQVGRSSFKTVSAMVVSYLIVLLLCYVIIILFDITPLICLPVGGLWVLQTIILVHYSNKEV